MRKLLPVALTVILSFTGTLADARPGKNKGKHESEPTRIVVEEKQHPVYPWQQKDDKEPWLKVQLSIPEKGILMRLADDIIALPHPSRQQNLPPGLAKNVARGKRLPPGWQKKLGIGKTFPQSIYDHAIPLPPYILHQLPVQPQGTALVVVQGKVVRLLEATKTIADVFNLKW